MKLDGDCFGRAVGGFGLGLDADEGEVVGEVAVVAEGVDFLDEGVEQGLGGLGVLLGGEGGEEALVGEAFVFGGAGVDDAVGVEDQVGAGGEDEVFGGVAIFLVD